MRIDFHQHYLIREGYIDDMLRMMDSLQIDLCVLHPLGNREIMFMGHAIGGNDDALTAATAHPDRILGSVYVDPRQADALGTIRKYHEAGFVCAKMHPTVGFYPDEERFQPVFAELEARKLPVLMHCGLTNLPYADGSGRITESKYAHPVYLDGVLRRFAGLKIVIAHMAWPYFPDAWGLATFNENAYLDIAGPHAVANGLKMHEVLGFGFDCGVDLFTKMIWGSDTITPVEHFHKTDKYLTQIGRSDVRDRVFGETAAELLGFTPSR